MVAPPRGIGLLAALAFGAAVLPRPATAGGYFLLGYGTYSYQSGGTVTAIGFDASAGPTNPAKLWLAGDRFDLGIQAMMPHRTVDRTGSGTPYDFDTTSRKKFFPLPEIAYARRLGENLAWGVAMYGNGGLNTEYHGDTGVPSSSGNPDACGDRPGNFFFGCGKVGFDLSQVIVAPTLSWQYASGQFVGIAPLFAYQQFKAYGLQAFQGISEAPAHVTNQGYDSSFGAGVRIGWLAKPLPWLSLGATYASRVWMQEFDEYRGLLADHGDFDIPANYSIGVGVQPTKRWTLGMDVQRVEYGSIRALSNAVTNSIADPDKPFGSRHGSGFNWRDVTTYRFAVGFQASERLTLRGGYAYGKLAQRDKSVDSTSFNMFAPNPRVFATAGASFALSRRDELNFAYGRYLQADFQGPSATAALGVGGRERIRPFVNTVTIGWSRQF